MCAAVALPLRLWKRRSHFSVVPSSVPVNVPPASLGAFFGAGTSALAVRLARYLFGVLSFAATATAATTNIVTAAAASAAHCSLFIDSLLVEFQRVSDDLLFVRTRAIGS